MNFIFPNRNIVKHKANSSNIRIYHNRKFPVNDILDVFAPHFSQFYPFKDLLYMITNAKHLFCAYDEVRRHCIGSALLDTTSDGQGLYLTLFATHQSSQHSGVGTKLLRTIIQWAYQVGYRFIQLHVHIDNYKAIGLYRKVGFRKYDYIPDYYKHSGKQNPDALLLILLLK